MNRGLQTVVAIALVSAATFGIYAFVSCKHPTMLHKARDNKNGNTRLTPLDCPTFAISDRQRETEVGSGLTNRRPS